MPSRNRGYSRGLGSCGNGSRPPAAIWCARVVRRRTENKAAATHADSISSDLSNEELEDLVHEATVIGPRRPASPQLRLEPAPSRAMRQQRRGLPQSVQRLLSGDRNTFGGVRGYALIAALVVALFCLILSGVRAYQAAAKRFGWLEPNDADRILRRAIDAADDRRRARLVLLAALLIASTRADLLADWKLDRFKQASRYFSFALIWVIVSAVLLVWPD
jgi:hypothetical protein